MFVSAKRFFFRCEDCNDGEHGFYFESSRDAHAALHHEWHKLRDNACTAIVKRDTDVLSPADRAFLKSLNVAW